MQRLRMSVPLALLVLLPVGHSWAGWNEGVAALKKGDYVAALREFRILAEQDDGYAQFTLGWMHHQGRGVPQDYAAEVATSRPTEIGTIRSGTEVRVRADGALASSAEGEHGRWRAWRLEARIGAVLTGLA